MSTQDTPQGQQPRRVNWQAVFTVCRDSVLTVMALVGIGYQQFGPQPVKWELLVLYAAVLGYGPLASAIVAARTPAGALGSPSSGPGQTDPTTSPSQPSAAALPSGPSSTPPPNASGS